MSLMPWIQGCLYPASKAISERQDNQLKDALPDMVECQLILTRRERSQWDPAGMGRTVSPARVAG
jgi:hypothetical protein